jgi:pimeloyl-ACP methyl ester carboxylesterase
MPSRSIGPAHLQIVEPAASAPAAPSILCLHGLFAGGWVFDDVLRLAAARGHRAAALTFRGRAPAADRDDLGRLSITDFLTDASAAVASLDRPIVIGHSLGGLVAQLLARDGLISAMVLVAPAPPRWISVMSPPLLARMVRYVPDLLLSRAFLPRPEDLDALVLNHMAPGGRDAVRGRLVADSGRASREAALGVHAVPATAVTVPTLVVSGDDDQFIPIGVSRRVAARFGAPLHVAAGHGHFLFGEPGWQAHVAVILDWIDALPPTAT